MTSESVESRSRTSSGAAVVALGDGPARYLADAWSRLVELEGGEADALEALDHPDSGFLVNLRREGLSSGAGSVESRQRSKKDEEAYGLTEKIREGLRHLGADGRLLGTGLFVGTGQRQDIPPELWANAKFEFASGRLMSGKFEYHVVTLREPEGSAAENDLDITIRDWLSDRRLQLGDEKKSALQAAARVAFGDAFTVRAFNTAYSAVYERKRGRPEKRNK